MAYSTLKRRTGLRPMSTKRRKEAPLRKAVLQAVTERQGGRCAAAGLLPTLCSGPLDGHEVIARSAWPGGHLVESNIVMLCRCHHTYVTEHPAESERLGLRKPSWKRGAA